MNSFTQLARVIGKSTITLGTITSVLIGIAPLQAAPSPSPQEQLKGCPPPIYVPGLGAKCPQINRSKGSVT